MSKKSHPYKTHPWYPLCEALGLCVQCSRHADHPIHIGVAPVDPPEAAGPQVAMFRKAGRD